MINQLRGTYQQPVQMQPAPVATNPLAPAAELTAPQQLEIINQLLQNQGHQQLPIQGDPESAEFLNNLLLGAEANPNAEDPDFLGNLLAAYGGATMGYGTPTDVVPPIAPIAEQEGFPMETVMYGALSLCLLAGTAALGRRWYNEYSAKHNIKKEINKRFRFGDNPEDNRANQREAFMPTNENDGNKDPIKGRDEEEKQRDPEHLGPMPGMGSDKNNGPAKDTANASVLSKGLGIIGSAAGAIASKVHMTKMDEKEEDNDPAKYHQLDAGLNEKAPENTDKQTRVWTKDGVKLVDPVTKQEILSSEPDVKKKPPMSESSFENLDKESGDETKPTKVKASVLIETDSEYPSDAKELEEINLDSEHEEQNGNFMKLDDNL